MIGANSDDPAYTDIIIVYQIHFNFKNRPTILCVLVGLGRIELPTSRLSGVRSNHLSYRPRALDNRTGVLKLAALD